MSDEHESASTALPTRRALREAERQAVRRERGIAGPVRPTPEPVELTIVAEELEAGTAAASPAAVSASPSAPAAPQVAAASATAASTTAVATHSRAGLLRRWAPRVAVLGSLAIATTAIPLSGAATTGSATADDATFAAVSALDVLAAEQVDGTDVFGGSASFAADPMAAARAMLSAGRTQGRDVLQCGSSALEANGQVAAGATTEPVDIMLPLQPSSYRLTSQYGYRWGGMHEGLDMAAPAGTPIHAVAAGEVTYAGGARDGRSGMIIVLEHVIDGETFWTWYVHMYPDGVLVNVGDVVSAGEVIGEVGSYGNSTGPHLHLEVHVDEALTTVDPAVWLAEHDAAPLTAENLACAAP